MKKVFFLLVMLSLTTFTFAQYSISGVVMNEKREVLPGANVVLAGTYTGTVADSNGKFAITNLHSGSYELLISFIGYEKTSQPVKLEKSNQTITAILKQSGIMTEEVMVSATRAGDKTPVAKTSVDRTTIENRNMGQDIPYLLTMTPSYVASSDAGAGVGYTDFRIRGTSANRINVTVNGIPMNDAESHGTYFVDIPDLAGSIDNIQVQRGVGTSTNGAAAFGATINLQTTTLNKQAYAEVKSSAGSFGTFKNSVAAGTGLMGKFAFDVRLSKVSSDGFIDRATSDLKSFFVSGGYYSENTILKVNIFSGFEETYQAWYGVPSVKLNNDTEGMQRYLDHWLWSGSERENQKRYDDLINSDARTYNFYTYENAVDHYQQDHYQLHFSHKFNEYLNLNAALHYTYGRGYYENYEYDQDYADYQMTAPEGIDVTDMVVRKWLDNDFYGSTYSLNYDDGKNAFTFGGGYNEYDGRHFGRVIWAQYMGDNLTVTDWYGGTSVDSEFEWYRGKGIKKDFNLFGKYNLQLNEALSFYADLQYRHIDYKITGIEDDLRDISQKHKFDFFNPKVGLYYKPNAGNEAYISFARANREPNRSNFVDADENHMPVAETLNDFEAGYTHRTRNYSIGANLYYMLYKDQLIQTGELNDVGSAIMVNVDDSYRAGIELMGGLKITRSLKWDVNATFSQNKIKNFTEYVDNWDYWYDMDNEPYQYVTDLGRTDLAFSPNVIVNSQLSFLPVKDLSISLLSNYVSDQYIDNSSSEDRKLNAWFVNNLKIDYTIKGNLFQEIKLHLMVNNLFDAEYESNAWVYSYYTGGTRYKMDGYFPQAGINFFAGIDFKF
ncbi:TonB-dependent receptor [Mangrovibacterium diazotrophicum]|uniref:Iron complex outermembrane receptor protein n=1 Tax=Mangrovibacterium diazotrophicum TaxID=1261403 RepID=A0A419W760_9BACT|nr:TonB-dependent receptor [Mangrovibacterium diazotrophicum]RKD91286.1 iron complex outermembrane receptor protein [Mangrovibacterium diazotrophicum]